LLATACSGKCPAITGTCTWSKGNQATRRHLRNRPKSCVERRRRDREAVNG
jgi:hypothetical protein